MPYVQQIIMALLIYTQDNYISPSSLTLALGYMTGHQSWNQAKTQNPAAPTTLAPLLPSRFEESKLTLLQDRQSNLDPWEPGTFMKDLKK